MFSKQKPEPKKPGWFKRTRRRIRLTIMVLSLGCNVAIAGGAHLGLIQGKVVPPAMSFGGYDEKHDQQLAMLAGAVDPWQLKPRPEVKSVAVKAAPVPAHKPNWVEVSSFDQVPDGASYKAVITGKKVR